MSKKLFALALSAMLVLSLLAGCGGNNGGSSAPASGNDGGSTAPAEKKTFTVGMECNYAPFNWTQVESDEFSVPLESAGHAGGYDVMMAKTLADKAGVEMPITTAAYQVLYEGKDPKSVVTELMTRDKKCESEESWV